MNLETAKILAGGSAKLSGSTGISTMIMAYFQVNAAGIGALCTLITLVFYISFQWLAHKKTNQSNKNKEKLDAHIESVRLLNEKMNEILDSLNSQNNDNQNT